MNISHIAQLKGKFILYKNRIHHVQDVYLSGSVHVLTTDIDRLNVLKYDVEDFLKSILVSNLKSELADFEREDTSADKIAIVDNVESKISAEIIPSEVERQTSNEQIALVDNQEDEGMTILPATGFHKAPFETTLQKHGSEMSNILMDTMRKLKAGVIKKEHVDGICAVAREMSNQIKDEINLIKTLKH
ncbi:hypothetical protein [Sphingobacterium sp. MYb388]|uniref:hypothetical protein n=1 Tax=Sphingobacterium sp. MYb388 TaxID=2745437 RepID=UPI003095F2D6